MIVKDGKLECVTSIEEDQYIIHKKTPCAFKYQVIELEFNLTISDWMLQE